MSTPKHIWRTTKQYGDSRDVVCDICGQTAWVEFQDSPETKSYGQKIELCHVALYRLELALKSNPAFRERVKFLLVENV